MLQRWGGGGTDYGRMKCLILVRWHEVEVKMGFGNFVNDGNGEEEGKMNARKRSVLGINNCVTKICEF